MKRILCTLLATCLFVGVFTGCTATESFSVESQNDTATAGFAIPSDINPTTFSEITGIPEKQAVMFVGDRAVSAEEYFYWLCLVCGSIESNILSDYNTYGMYSTYIDSNTKGVDWSAKMNGVLLMDYAASQTESSIKYSIAIEELAAEYGVTLTTQDLQSMDDTLQSSVADLGGVDVFVSYLQMLGVSRSTFDKLSASGYLYNSLVSLALTEGNDLYLPAEKYSNYAAYADHILIATQNMKSGESLSYMDIMEKYAVAEGLLEQLQTSSDPVALFDQLADEYSDDPGRMTNPTGYIYTTGTMVQEFESAVASLKVGEISNIVQSDYGFHIILRRDLTSALETNQTAKEGIAREYLNDLLIKKRSLTAVTYAPCLEDFDRVAFYKAYTDKVDEMSVKFSQMPNN